MAEPLDQPLGVVPRDELPDDAPRLVEGPELVQVDALLLERAHEAPLHSGSPTYEGEIVQPSHFTSLIQASAIYCGPQSHRIAKPRATSLPNRPKAWRTPWRMGSRAAQLSPSFAVCHPTTSS
jgi:hypothetical protein